jgi:hypothetical protein
MVHSVMPVAGVRHKAIRTTTANMPTPSKKSGTAADSSSGAENRKPATSSKAATNSKGCTTFATSSGRQTLPPTATGMNWNMAPLMACNMKPTAIR